MAATPVPRKVLILNSAGCVNTPPAVARIQAVAARLGLQVELLFETVQSEEQAVALRFLGSPTIQIAGRDLDPAARASTSFGFT